MSQVTEALSSAPPGWDALTVDPPGGHLLQGSAWAEHRRPENQSADQCFRQATLHTRPQFQLREIQLQRNLC